jgi:hypothetical protein
LRMPSLSGIAASHTSAPVRASSATMWLSDVAVISLSPYSAIVFFELSAVLSGSLRW